MCRYGYLQKLCHHINCFVMSFFFNLKYIFFHLFMLLHLKSCIIYDGYVVFYYIDVPFKKFNYFLLYKLWTWVWGNSGSWWWTGRPGVLRFMGSQRVGHDWASELNWTELNLKPFKIKGGIHMKSNALGVSGFLFYLFIVWPCHTVYGILVTLAGFKARPLAVRARSPNHWTTREFPSVF